MQRSLLAFVMLLGCTTGVFAAKPEKPVDLEEHLLQKADVDKKDGMLSEKETKLARMDLVSRVRQSLDKGSAVIDLPTNPIVRVHAFGKTPLGSEIFASLRTKIGAHDIDTNDDKMVSPEELHAFVAEMQTAYSEALKTQAEVVRVAQAEAEARRIAEAAARAAVRARNPVDKDDDKLTASERRALERERDRDRRDREQVRRDRGSSNGGGGGGGGGGNSGGGNSGGRDDKDSGKSSNRGKE